jgi:hypothetical protein
MPVDVDVVDVGAKSLTVGHLALIHPWTAIRCMIWVVVSKTYKVAHS